MKENGKTADLFAAALELKTGERARFLAAECGANKDLRREVEELLIAFKNAESNEFLSASALEAEAAHFDSDESDRRLGQTLGRYKIGKKIGAGGMGAIYLATREDGEFQKRVAVKILKRGMDTEAILRRFRNERQILASLEHPNIAHLHDGGTTADGLPYLVMEFIEGVPVDEFCRRNELSEREKIELFRTICSAVAFAHRNLIIHRDLKPSNILVTKTGEPKLLDFGIAKLLDETEAEFLTQTNLRVLTPAYASPEQAAGENVTTATDVYSLGVVLHELLTGKRPLLNGKKNDEQRTTNGEQKLKGDLSNIVGKALRLEPERRYSSVEKFSDDLRRYLGGLPVSARPDTFAYRAKKFVGRNKLPVAAALIFLLLLAAGVAAIIWEARIAQIERAKAERRAENLRKLSNSFAIELHNAILNLPGSLPARQLLLARAVEQLDALAAESDGNAQLQDELAEGYYRLGEMPAISVADADANYRKSIAIYQTLLRNDPQNIKYRRQLAKGYELLGDLEKVRGSTAGTLDFYRRASEILEKVSAEDRTPENLADLSAVYSNIAANLYFVGEARESLAVARRALALSEEIARRVPENFEYRQSVEDAHSAIAKDLQYLGDYQGAINELLPLVSDYAAQTAREPNDVRINYALWAFHRRLGAIYEQSGDGAAALEHLNEAVETMENLLRESPDDVGYQRNTAFSHLSLGQSLLKQNQPQKAFPHLERALALSENLIAADAERGESIQDLGGIHNGLGATLVALGNRAEGLRHFRQSIEFFEKAVVRDDQNAVLRRDFAEAEMTLAAALVKNGGEAERLDAKKFYERSLTIWREMQAKNILSAFDTAKPEDAERALQQFKN